MAKKQTENSLEENENKPKKKGLFGFLRRKPKAEKDTSKDKVSEEVKVEAETSEPEEKPAPKRKSAAKKASAAKKTTAKPKSTAAKTSAKKSDAKSEKPVAKKRKSTAKTKPESKASVAGAKGTEKSDTSQKEEDIAITASEAHEDAAPGATKKKFLGFLRRKKKARANENGQADQKIDGKEAIALSSTESEDGTSEVKKKKGLFGFLKRKKKSETKEAEAASPEKLGAPEVDISIPPVGGDVLQMELNPGAQEALEAENAPKKKFGFLSNKLMIIIFALCGVSGATGAAAIVFAGPLLGNDPALGLACQVAHKTDFELMREKRVTAFIRSDTLPPRQRIELLMRYTKFLETEYADTNLFTVSLIDTDGPTTRQNFRGHKIGAQIVYAPDPLLSLATDRKWEVRYVNADQTHAGRFIGERFTLSVEEIKEIEDNLLEAADCYVEKTEEELAEEEAAAEEAAVEAEAQAAEEALMAEEVAVHEPGFIDNMLSMVGLGGGEDEMESGDMLDEAGEGMEQAYPGDMGPHADVMKTEPGFFDGILAMVGLGGADEEEMDKIPGVLGTRVKYQ